MNSTRFAAAQSAAALALALLAASPAHAKGTLVYCSEGSPEGFSRSSSTTGTTFDAVSVPMFNRLVEFETGTTNIVPATGRVVDGVAGRQGLHVQARARASSSTATRTSSRRATSTPTTCSSRGIGWPTTIIRSTR